MCRVLVIQVLVATLFLSSFEAFFLKGETSGDLCSERCNITEFVPGAPCQCNSVCPQFKDCCLDYNADICSRNVGSHKLANLLVDLPKISEELFKLDIVNNPFHLKFATINTAAPPLVTFSNQQAAYELPTIKALRTLYQHFELNLLNPENADTGDKRDAITEFVDLVWNTPIMKKLIERLEGSKITDTDLRYIWFGMYPRPPSTNDVSSGFEHVFMAEHNKPNFVGFHNWLFLANNNAAVRYSVVKNVNLGDKGNMVELRQLTWTPETEPYNKIVSSMFVGLSPELELALYTLCFVVAFDDPCPVSLNGITFNILMKDIVPKDRARLVFTAYPVVP